jgi:hypothetical protein
VLRGGWFDGEVVASHKMSSMMRGLVSLNSIFSFFFSTAIQNHKSNEQFHTSRKGRLPYFVSTALSEESGKPCIL